MKPCYGKLAWHGPDRFVWRSDAEGVAKQGLFVRRAAPAFHFRFPAASRKHNLTAPSHVMQMRAPSAYRFSANLLPIPEGISLADAGPKAYTAILQAFAKDIRVVRNQPIILGDGTQAYKTDFNWRFRKIRIKTHLVSAYRQGKWIFLTAHPWRRGQYAKEVVRSLRFDDPN